MVIKLVLDKRKRNERLMTFKLITDSTADLDENWANDITLLEVMKKLKEKERNIINKRFFEGRTQMEVAEEIGISQAQVSRLEKNAIEHIKKLYN